ncbi:MAG: hypothetical protein Q9224_000360 [Gallowayella concinna]
MNYRDIEEYPGQTSSRYTSGPSAYVAPNDLSSATPGNSLTQQSAGRNDTIRQANILKMTEPSYGSPSRYVGKSPNPRDQASARAPCPPALGLGNIRETAQIDDSACPKSAPAHVKSFGDRTREENLRPWDPNNIDNRWQQGSDEMLSLASNSTSRQTTSSQAHWELLQAQLGNLGAPSNGQVQNRTNAAFSTGKDNGAVPNSFNGHSFEDLVRYVVRAQTGQPPSPIPELERLMSTMLGLRDKDDVLLSVERSGRDLARQYMYQQIFGSDDGSSRLSRENPEEPLDVAGTWITRMALHNQIVFFLEDKLERMTSSPSPQNGNSQAYELNANGHRGNGISHHYSPSSTSDNYVKEAQVGVTERQRSAIGRSNIRTPSMLTAQNLMQKDQNSSPVHGFEGLHLGPTSGVDNNSTQAHHGSGLAVIPNVNSQAQPPRQCGMTSAFGYAPQDNYSYGQPSMGLLPQQGSGGPFPQQFLGPQSMLYGPPYLPSQFSPMSFYAGGQHVHQAGPVLPYGSPYLRLAAPQGNFMSGPQLPMNAYQHWPAQQPYLPNPVGARVPNYLGSVYGTTSRANSPSRNPDGSFRARTPRTVVSEVTLLPYRPGSDDMYPYGQHGGSIQYQELTRNGGPTYESAARAEVLPFAENARKSKPAEWGVLRIGNVSSKQ